MLLLLWVLAPPSSARAQAHGSGAVVSVQLSTGVAKIGEQVVLSLTVENARDARLVKVPDVEGLRLGNPAGPFKSQYTEIVRNRISERIQTEWRIAIRASDEGQFTIPPFDLLVDGNEVQSKPVSLKVLRDLRGEDVGFFEIRPSSQRVVEGQPFTLELRFGWDAGVSANYASLSLPWWGALPGTLELEREPDQKATTSVVVNEEVQVAVERVPSPADGRTVYRLVRSFMPTRSGPIQFPTSFLEFGQLGERRLLSAQRKIKSYYVRAEAFEIDVVALPREGQPFDYSGAVGALTVRSTTDTRDVVVGDSIKLTVDWSGAGNLEFFEAPDLGLLDPFRDFQVYGSTEQKSFGRRRVVYDLAPLTAEVDQIPSVPLSVYDPEAEAYVTVETDPVAIRVRPLERPIELGEPDAERFERDIADIDPTPLTPWSARTGERAVPLPGDRALLIGFGVTPLLWLSLRGFVRRRRRDPDAPLEKRRRRARKDLSRRLRDASDPARRLAAFTTFLSARTREPDEAWTGRDPDAWKAQAGEAGAESVIRELDSASDLLRRLEAGAYGDGAPVENSEVLAVADRLVRSGL